MEMDVVNVSVISNVDDDDTSFEIEFIIVEVTSVVEVGIVVVVVDIVIAVAASMI